MVAVIMLIGLLFAWYSIVCFKKSINIIQSVIFTFIGYFFGHVLLSGFLFFFDWYSIEKTLVMCMIFWGIMCAIALVKKKSFEVEFDIKNYILPIIVTLIGVPFLTLAPFEYFGMGQDEGIYQTQAILFMNGITGRQYDIEEYYLVDSLEEKDAIMEATNTNQLQGIYIYSKYNLHYFLTNNDSTSISETAGVLHGIPTFSALLALWGKIFGMEHMAGVSVLFWICCIFLLYEICVRLNMNIIGKCLTLFIYVWSPIVIWTGKSALTETGLTLIWLVFIYNILGKSNKNILLSALCVTVYSFYHVSVYAFMPLYVLMYVGLYLISSQKIYLKALIVSVVGYLAGFWFACETSYAYVIGNYNRIYYWFIDASNIFYIVNAVCIIFILFGIGLLCGKTLKFTWKKKYVNYAVKAFFALVFVYLVMKGIQKQISIMNFAIVAFIVLTGIIVPIIVLGNVSFCTSRWLEDKDRGIMLVLFLYCIVFYSVFSMTFHYYYYYARYFVMYIPIIAIMGGLILQNVKQWKALVIIVVNILLFLPFNYCLLREKDDSRFEWNTLSEISEVLEPNDVLILDPEFFYAFYLPLKAMNDIDIYPVYSYPVFDNLEEQCEELDTESNHIYYLTYNVDRVLDGKFLLRLRIQNEEVQDKRLESNNIFQMPTSFTKTMWTFSLYQCD